MRLLRKYMESPESEPNREKVMKVERAEETVEETWAFLEACFSDED